MKTHFVRRVVSAGGVGVALAIGGILLAPGASAAPITAPLETRETPSEDCRVTSADLVWGVKESFRSYISGSIADGAWTTEGGAGYETPSFLWSTDGGEVSGELDSGSIPFAGGVHFTGHDGALALDLADPAVEFAEGGAAHLLLDLGATDAAQDGAPAMERLRAATIDLEGSLTAGGDAISIAAAPVRLTAEGAEAFNGGYGGYAAGDEMDPISLTATVTGCELASIAPSERQDRGGSAGSAEPDDAASGEAAETRDPQASPEIPWTPIVIGGIALLVIGVTGGMLLSGRGRG